MALLPGFSATNAFLIPSYSSGSVVSTNYMRPRFHVSRKPTTYGSGKILTEVTASNASENVGKFKFLRQDTRATWVGEIGENETGVWKPGVRQRRIVSESDNCRLRNGKFKKSSKSSKDNHNSDNYQTNFHESKNNVLLKRMGQYAEKIIKPSQNNFYYSGNPLRRSQIKSKFRDNEADNKNSVSKGSISHKLERLTSNIPPTRKNVITNNNKSTKKYSNKSSFSKTLLKSALRKRKLKSKSKSYSKKTSNNDASLDKVFEFETTISVSLDTSGYMMTIILISQIIIFGMVLYSRSLNE